MRSSAFDFLKGTAYEPALVPLSIFEQDFLLSPDTAGEALRDFWETFCECALEDHDLRRPWLVHSQGLREEKKSVSLGTKMNFLFKNPKFAPKEGTNPISKFYQYEDHAGKKCKVSRFEDDYEPQGKDLLMTVFLLNYANAFHHRNATEFKGVRYRVSFYHTLDYIKRLHGYLMGVLGIRSAQPPKFWEMPLVINNGQTVFYLDRTLDLGAAPQFLDCCYVFSGIMYPNRSKPDSYPAIIMMFSKDAEDITKERLDRAAEVYDATRNSNFGEALREIRVLSGRMANAEYYIRAYVFEGEPRPLTEELVRTIPMNERLLICREIARIISRLHGANPSISNRLLNHKCVYLCRDIDEEIPWYPSVLGFNFAKINDERPSVFLRYDDQVDHFKEYPDTALYIPAGWEEMAQEYGELVDIYSMGILFFNILSGSFQHPITVDDEHLIIESFDYIRETLKELPDEIADLILEMLSPCGEDRPAAKEVYRVLRNLCD